jgi:hypothetical protein
MPERAFLVAWIAGFPGKNKPRRTGPCAIEGAIGGIWAGVKRCFDDGLQ